MAALRGRALAPGEMPGAASRPVLPTDQQSVPDAPAHRSRLHIIREARRHGDEARRQRLRAELLAKEDRSRAALAQHTVQMKIALDHHARVQDARSRHAVAVTGAADDPPRPTSMSRAAASA